MSNSVICAFDIGIKNLAFCVFNKSTERILGWENVNILADGAAAAPEAPKCEVCSAAAKFRAGDKSLCRRHIAAHGGGLKPLADADGKIFTKLPAVKVLKTLAAPGKRSREEIITNLATRFALPIEAPPKPKAATSTPLTVLHDAIRAAIEARWALLSQCSLFCLENQPVLKNPTMKSVQILLFASIREAFLRRGFAAPEMRLVHAGKKVTGVVAGDAGYADRKAGGEARAIAFCTAKAPDWLPTIRDAKKKSDLADALCMVLDASI